ncbi:hypothetical protein ACFQH8_04030 [Halomicroarcula sp. GCM10025710]
MRRTGCVVAFVLVTTVLVAPTASAGTFGALPSNRSTRTWS